MIRNYRDAFKKRWLRDTTVSDAEIWKICNTVFNDADTEVEESDRLEAMKELETHDTSTIRRQMVAEQRSEGPLDRAALEAKYGKVWDATELAAEFSVTGFGAPVVAVKRRSDGVIGSLEFQHSPRFYYGWKEHE